MADTCSAWVSCFTFTHIFISHQDTPIHTHIYLTPRHTKLKPNRSPNSSLKPKHNCITHRANLKPTQHNQHIQHITLSNKFLVSPHKSLWPILTNQLTNAEHTPVCDSHSFTISSNIHTKHNNICLTIFDTAKTQQNTDTVHKHAFKSQTKTQQNTTPILFTSMHSSLKPKQLII